MMSSFDATFLIIAALLVFSKDLVSERLIFPERSWALSLFIALCLPVLVMQVALHYSGWL